MGIAILNYNKNSKKWEFNGTPFHSFIDGLKELSNNFDVLGWCYFPEDKAILKASIIKNKTNELPELVTFGSQLFLENSEYLEAQNPYFNSFSTGEKGQYDTWRVRSNAGYISTSIIKELSVINFPKSYKTSLAVLGYFSYKIGGLVIASNKEPFTNKKIEGLNDDEYIEAISFFKKKQWILFYVINRFLFDNKLLLPIKYLFKNNYILIEHKPSLWDKVSKFSVDISLKSVDVVIPTLGRADFVYQTLLDLNEQDIQINKVILVEQKLPNQKETLLKKTLDYNWKFNLEHVLLEELGLCNARNVGFGKSKADYIVMLDDDIRIDNQPNILENLIVKLETSKAQIISFASNNIKGNTFSEMSYFVSGCSFLIRNNNILPFNLDIEGMGCDDQEYNNNVHDNHQRVIYTNLEYINHLRAPMGGWRFDAKEFLPWYDGGIVPLPGPVTLHRYLKYATENQLKGYKFFVFFKYYKFKIWKYSLFNKRWEKSLLWANKIIEGKVKLDIKSGVLKN